MELYLANFNYVFGNGWVLNIEELIEDYVDIIWTKRWQEYGDFVLTIPIMALKTISNYSDLVGKVICLRDIDNANVPDDYMLIEKYTLTYDYDENEVIVIEGNDLVSILGRRIIWGQTSFRDSQTLKSICNKLVDDAISNPTNIDRKIENFLTGTYTADDTVSASQKTYTNLYETIVELCEDNYSPDVNYEFAQNIGNFIFTLYSGTDRTLSSDNPLIFSESMNNLQKYQYLKDITEYKNAWLCAGEGEGLDRLTATYSLPDAISINRRELYIDARDISRNDDEGLIPTATYTLMLGERISEKKSENEIKEACTSELTFQGVVYGVDYKVGDKATLIDSLGASHDIRITEFIRCMDSNGYQEYPNFKLLQ